MKPAAGSGKARLLRARARVFESEDRSYVAVFVPVKTETCIQRLQGSNAGTPETEPLCVCVFFLGVGGVFFCCGGGGGGGAFFLLLGGGGGVFVFFCWGGGEVLFFLVVVGGWGVGGRYFGESTGYF